MIKDNLYPQIVGIPVTNKCNLSCNFCRRNIYLDNGQINDEEMSIENIKTISDKLVGKCEIVNISAGFGEPLLHSQLYDVIKCFRENDIKVMMYTNSLLLNDQNIEKLGNSNLNTLIISLDLEHLGGYYNVNLKNTVLKRILKLNKISFDNIIISSVIDPFSFSKEFFLELIEFSLLNSIKLEFKWRHMYTSIKKNKKIIVEIEKLASNYQSMNLISFPVFNRKNKTICIDLWKSMYFTQAGFLRNCCVYYEHIVESKNIFIHEIQDIWNSDEIKDLRNSFIEGKYPKYCDNCPIGSGCVYI